MSTFGGSTVYHSMFNVGCIYFHIGYCITEGPSEKTCGVIHVLSTEEARLWRRYVHMFRVLSK